MEREELNYARRINQQPGRMINSLRKATPWQDDLGDLSVLAKPRRYCDQPCYVEYADLRVRFDAFVPGVIHRSLA